MSDVRCEICGGVVEGKKYFTYCSYQKGFIHVGCEQKCENYCADMLKNGTHCRKKYYADETKYRLLSSRILAPEYDVQGAVGKYEKFDSYKLYEKFREGICLYNNISRDECELREQYRVELAAMQQILRKRELENPKLSLWARRFFSEVGEVKDD